MDTIISEITGYARITVYGRAAERILNRINNEEIPIYDIQRAGENSISFCALSVRMKKLTKILKEARNAGLKYDVKMNGLPSYAARFFVRPGLFAGVLTGLFLLIVSGKFIWTVDITGNALISEERIREMLCGAGIYEGAVISDIDIEKARMDVVTANPEIAFVTFFISGTDCFVTVHERTYPPEANTDDHPYNLVASRDGIVKRFVVNEGIIVPKTGEYVKKGDLLVSGIVELNTTSYRMVHSSGSVYAETVHHFSVEHPLITEKKMYTGRESVKRSVSILGANIPLFIFPSCGYEMYDMISKTENAFLFDILRLPFRIKETRYLEYSSPVTFLTSEQALAEAYDILAQKLSEELDGAEITKKEIKPFIGEDCVSLEADVWCIEDIALEKPINTSENAG